MRKLNFILVLGALALPIHVFALGLGEIKVNSDLNQKLDAKIELISAAPEDAEVLIVNLAPREAFAKAGIDRPQSLNALKFKTLVENKKVYISVTSGTPIRDPSLNFLMEIDWPQGHLLREYTILLAPPVFKGQKEKREAATPSTRPSISDDSFRFSEQP